MLTYFHCLDTDKLWFWETTWTVQNYCLKKGRLALISSIVISVAMSSWHQVMSKLCCWVIWHDFWPLTVKIKFKSNYWVHYWVQSPVHGPVQSTGFVLFPLRASTSPSISTKTKQYYNTMHTYTICLKVQALGDGHIDHPIEKIPSSSPLIHLTWTWQVRFSALLVECSTLVNFPISLSATGSLSAAVSLSATVSLARVQVTGLAFGTPYMSPSLSLPSTWNVGTWLLQWQLVQYP